MSRIIIVDDDAGLTEALIAVLGHTAVTIVGASPRDSFIVNAPYPDLTKNVEVTKPERSNFSRFQNNFKRRGR